MTIAIDEGLIPGVKPMASLIGGRFCEAMRYSCAMDPVFMVNCHCRDCQSALSSAYLPDVVVHKACFFLL